MSDIRYVTNSELSTFRRCRRKWWLAYYRRLQLQREPVTGVRTLGTRLHEALAAYYAPEPQDLFTVFLTGVELDIINNPDDEEALRKDRDLGVIMLEGYVQWAEEEGVDEGLEVYETEQKIDAHLMSATDGQPEVRLLGKLDARAKRDWDDSRWFIDHKSVGSLTEPLKTIQMDTQMKHYHLLEVLHESELQPGVPVTELPLSHGGLYNMLKRVKRTARANPPFFARHEVRHNAHEIRMYWYNVGGQVTDIQAVEWSLNSGMGPQRVAYPSPRASCSWDCDFALVCPLFDDGSAAEALLTSYYVEHDPLTRYAEQTGDDE